MTNFLLVEDDAHDALFVRRAFARASPNSRLAVVSDGQEAMDYLEGKDAFSNRDEHPLPNVILLDLKMPRVGGFDFLAWLQEQAAASIRLIPVIVMSSSRLPEDVDKAYALGANSYLVKPVNWNLFNERMKALSIYWTEHVETPHQMA